MRMFENAESASRLTAKETQACKMLKRTIIGVDGTAGKTWDEAFELVYLLAEAHMSSVVEALVSKRRLSSKLW